MLSALSTFVATVTGKAVLATAVVATGTGGLHAAGAVQLPFVADAEPAGETVELTADPTPTPDASPVPTPTPTPEPTPQPTATPTPDAEPSPTPDGELTIDQVDGSDGLDEDELAVLCDEAANHGEYVSRVARDGADDDAVATNHGEFVREAAHSDCGKSDDGDGDGDADGTVKTTEAGSVDEDESDGGSRTPPAHSNAGGNGKGPHRDR